MISIERLETTIQWQVQRCRLPQHCQPIPSACPLQQARADLCSELRDVLQLLTRIQRAHRGAVAADRVAPNGMLPLPMMSYGRRVLRDCLRAQLQRHALRRQRPERWPDVLGLPERGRAGLLGGEGLPAGGAGQYLLRGTYRTMSSPSIFHHNPSINACFCVYLMTCVARSR